MQFAIVDGIRREAFSKGRGICPICGANTIAKFGTRITHHWAHENIRDCDPWWENETPWHREWKNCFPADCREVTHVSDDGEIHRADIKTPTGIVVEIQHSNMTDTERISREVFYKNMIWIVDGKGFNGNFDIYHMLPNPHSELARDIVWCKAKRHMHGSNAGLFFRMSEARTEFPGATKATIRGGLYHGIKEIQDEVEAMYNGFHQYDWVRPRKTWLESKSPVYIDFGEDRLVKIDIYDESGLECIRLVSKKKIIHDLMTETEAKDIASRFYPIPVSET